LHYFIDFYTAFIALCLYLYCLDDASSASILILHFLGILHTVSLYNLFVFYSATQFVSLYLLSVYFTVLVTITGLVNKDEHISGRLFEPQSM